MPNSNVSSYSTASKHVIAQMEAEMARKDAENVKRDAAAAAAISKKDVEMLQIRTQMEEMAKIINNMQATQTVTASTTPAGAARGRGQGRGQTSSRGTLGGRGRGRGLNPQGTEISQPVPDSQSSTRSQSKKRGCDDLTGHVSDQAAGKFVGYISA